MLATLPAPLSSQQRLALGLASLFGSTGPIVLAKLERRLNASLEENERGLERPLEHVQVLADTFKTKSRRSSPFKSVKLEHLLGRK
jgi:hypothetical protein